MADENVPAPAPTRSDDQILPFIAWMPIGKSNFVLDLQNKQKNPIFQFWDTLVFEVKIGAYHFQLDEDWFILDTNLIREALEITLGDQAHKFVSPPLAMHTFLANKANLSNAPQKGKKTKPHVIPYCRFTKLIICHLGRTHNIHQRYASPLHLAEEDHRLGNLNFFPKGEEDKVFGMQIPKELITNNIRNELYYNAYMEMVAKHDKKITAKKGGKKKSASKAD
ncbi:hypothetical protein Tco_0572241 [Tanacetum coccineum]